jgi:hypothetical protein
MEAPMAQAGGKAVTHWEVLFLLLLGPRNIKIHSKN